MKMLCHLVYKNMNVIFVRKVWVIYLLSDPEYDTPAFFTTQFLTTQLQHSMRLQRWSLKLYSMQGMIHISSENERISLNSL